MSEILEEDITLDGYRIEAGGCCPGLGCESLSVRTRAHS